MLRKLVVLGACMAFADPALSEPLTGVFNTGVSDAQDTGAASLDIRFHACEADPELTCATIERLVNPAPNSKKIMPDGTPVIGFTMITELKDKGGGKYRSGRINAIDESLTKDKMVWYGLKVDNQFDGTLKARGCLGPVCPRVMIWRAVTEEQSSENASQE